MKDFCPQEEAGLTLVEILVAVAIIMIGLVAVMQWFPLGTAGVETGRRQSTAVFLAEQRMEQIRAWVLSGAAGVGFPSPGPFDACNPCNGAGTPLVSENFNVIPGYPDYQRRVIVQAGPTASTRVVRVQVWFRRVTSTGVFTSGVPNPDVDLATMIASRS